MPAYNPEHLHQCVRNLFYQAIVEFPTVHHIQETMTQAVQEDQDDSARVGAYWNNSEDCFMGTLMRVFRLKGKEQFLIELIVWSKETRYESSKVVGRCCSAEELKQWLLLEENVEYCISIVDRLLNNIYTDLR